MIKFTAIEEDRGFIGIGLSEGNINKLKEGKPILFKLSDMGMNSKLEVIIFYGETEEAMAEELKQFIGPDTYVETFDKFKQ